MSAVGSSLSQHALKGDSKEDFFHREMVLANLESFHAGENRHLVGCRNSFLPILGEKVWESCESDSFQAYIFEKGEEIEFGEKRIGYLRIPTFMGCEAMATSFKGIIELFEESTDLLVIDQLHNGGGSLFYLYALVSMVTDRPLEVPKHRLLLTQEEVHRAAMLLQELERVTSDGKARELFGDTLGGYPINLEFAKGLENFCTSILDFWGWGEIHTPPIALFGIEKIQPHPTTHYSKPIVLLIDELDFSAADFFPAIMQDNSRALLFGKESAGAGGYLVKVEMPNQLGLSSFCFTGSQARRTSGLDIENIGVQPDIAYEPTVQDLVDGYSGYAAELVNLLDQIVEIESQ